MRPNRSRRPDGIPGYAVGLRLRELVTYGPYPQLLLRVGYAPTDHPTVRPTPRRTVADVLT